MENEIIELTAYGKSLLEKELRELVEVERPQVIRELKEAKEQGDLSENADYDAARKKQGEIEGKIRELEYTLSHCKVISAGNASVVAMSTTVTLKFLDNNEVETYTIGGQQEVNLDQNRISTSCPLTQAIMSHRIGDVVVVDVKVPYQVEILDIKSAE